jgi:hypothetical protein
VLGFQRQWRNERTLVLINYGTEAAELSVPSLPPAATAQRIWPRNSASLRADHNGTAGQSCPRKRWPCTASGGESKIKLGFPPGGRMIRLASDPSDRRSVVSLCKCRPARRVSRISPRCSCACHCAVSVFAAHFFHTPPLEIDT